MGMNYIKTEVEVLFDSFRFRKKNFLALVYDVVFTAVFSFFFYLIARKSFNLLMTRIATLDYSGLMMGKNVEPVYYALVKFYGLVFGMFIVFFFAMMLVHSLFGMLVWNDLLEKEFSGRKFLKFFFSNALLTALIIPVLFYLASHFEVKGIISAFIVLFVFIYFFTLFKMSFIEHGLFWRALKNAFVDFVKVHEFIFFFASLIVLGFVFYSLAFFNLFILIPFVILLFVFWMRKYFAAAWKQ